MSRPVRWFSHGAPLAGTLLGTLLLHPRASFLPLGADELSWLASGAGLARAVTDAWVGLVPREWLMRLPVLLILAGSLFVAGRISRKNGLLAALAVPIAAAALLGPWLRGLPLVFPAPWGLLTAALVLLALGSRTSRPVRWALPLLGMANLVLEPASAFLPLGAATGAWLGAFAIGLSRRGSGSTHAAPGQELRAHGSSSRARLGREGDGARDRGGHDTPLSSSPPNGNPVATGSSLMVPPPAFASAVAVTGWLAAGLLLALHPSLSPSPTQPKAVLLLQALLVAAALSIVSASILLMKGSTDDDHGLTLATLGALLGGTMCVLVPGLRSLSASASIGLLYLALPATALATSAASRRASSTAASERSRTPFSRGSGILMHPGIPLLCLIPLALLTWTLARPRPSRPVPLPAALARMKERAPSLRQVVPGPGVTIGALRHAAASIGFEVADRPFMEPLVGMVGLAAVAPSLSRRNEITAILGDRVLDTYGIVSGTNPADEGPAVRWSVSRPYRVTIPAEGPRPNIAIVSVDTLRADHLSVYGYARETSPNLHEWSRSALVYERAMSAAPSTAPSFTSLLSGRLPVGHGVRKNYEFLDPGNQTLPRLLKRAGYHTAAFISSFVLTAENSGLDLGFDVYDQTFEVSERNRRDRPLRLAPALLSAVQPWLRDPSRSEAPWFLWIHTIDPHGPYTPLPDFARAFQGGPRRSLPRSVIPDYQWLDSVELSDYVNAYDDEILQTDASLGPILRMIRGLDGPRGTLVIFVADHGEAFGEHGVYFQHGQSLHTEEIHVPLIVEDTRSPRSGRIETPVSLVDIVPTVLSRLGISSDLPLDGMTLDEREASEIDIGAETTKSRSAGNSRTARDSQRPVSGTWKPGEVMVCRWPWKLMLRGGVDAATAHLYNILTDPHEAHPLPLSSAQRPLETIARHLLERDPLTPAAGSALEAQQWEALDPDAKQKLKSLGYGGP